MGRQQVKCHGDIKRFEAVSDYIYDVYGSSVRYIADVAGGQGLLSKTLNKRYNYISEVIDPRGYVLKGIQNRQCEYTADMADYYDLIVGLHPDEALRPVVESARYKPVIVVPCCNCWDKTRKLGTKELIDAIEEYLIEQSIHFEKLTFDFKGPKNVGFHTMPWDALSSKAVCVTDSGHAE